jgi:hypothetical protein
MSAELKVTAILLRVQRFLTEPNDRLTFDQALLLNEKEIPEEPHDKIAERG